MKKIITIRSDSRIMDGARHVIYRVSDDGGDFDDIEHVRAQETQNDIDDRAAHYRAADYYVRLVTT